MNLGGSFIIIIYILLYMDNKEKLVIIMVGLPGRGKSYLSKKIFRYFNWAGYNIKIFNVGEYRRSILGGFQDSDFFNPNNQEAFIQRESIAQDLLKQLIIWISDDNNRIAIFDATNTTINRRKNIHKMLLLNHITPLYIEIICKDTGIINDNIKMKLISPDYCNIDSKIAMSDFNNRLSHYISAYAPISMNENLKFIKMVNYPCRVESGINITKSCNSMMEITKIENFLDKELLSYLLNVKTNKNPIFLTRHGESIYNIHNKIGGDSSLSNKGKCYPQKLYNYIIKNENYTDMVVYTSILKRTMETCYPFVNSNLNSFIIKNYKSLSEINAGICENLTFDEVKSKYPEIYIARKKDKFNYRYPQGESYHDLVIRVKPFILELENSETPILVISHNAITRVIYAYLMEMDPKNIPHFDIPLHTLIKLSPNASGYLEEKIKLD